MKTYRINYGHVPFKTAIVAAWDECSKMIKKLLDEGTPVQSVSIEYEYNDQSNNLEEVFIEGNRNREGPR